MIYVSSDHHFGHFNIAKFCNRNHDSVEAMDEALIAAWNRTGYCVKCYKLTEVKKEMACRFCIVCEKAISASNLSGLCRDCSNGQRSKKTIFKKREAIEIIDGALSDLNIEEKTRTEVLMVFMNLLRRRFFLGYTGNNHALSRRTDLEPIKKFLQVKEVDLEQREA